MFSLLSSICESMFSSLSTPPKKDPNPPPKWVIEKLAIIEKQRKYRGSFYDGGSGGGRGGSYHTVSAATITAGSTASFGPCM